MFLSLFLDNERYMRIYQEQLKNKKSLKVNIIQCMNVGPLTVDKTSLKEQLLANNEENTTTFAQKFKHYQLPSSSVCENLKRIQIILNCKQCKQSNFTVAVDNKYTWKTLLFDEEVIGYLKMSLSNNKINSKMSLWTFLFILRVVAIYVNCAILPLAYLPEREITFRNNVVSFETRMDAFYFFIILLFLCF